MKAENHRVRFAILCVVAIVTFASTRESTRSVAEAAPNLPSLSGSQPPAKARLVEGYAKLPLSFEANQGQTDAQVQFLSRGSGYTLFLTGNEAVLALQRAKSRSADLSFRSAAFSGPFSQRTADLQNKSAQPGSLFPGFFESPAAAFESHGALDPSRLTPHSSPAPAVVRLKLVGANRAAKATGLDELPGKSNYFIGNDPKRWRTNVANYAKVKYKGVYPGVDLVYYGNQRQLEYDFVIAPGADPKAITLAIDGPAVAIHGSPLHIDAEGDLVIGTDSGEVRFHKPVAYQPTNSADHSQIVDGRYVLLADNRIGFDVAAYDPSKPLVIDPTLSYSTYLGGNGSDFGAAIAVDSSGNAYVTGGTASTNFPTNAGAFQSVNNAAVVGDYNAFVAKINAAGTALVYSTYLGGNSPVSSNAAFGGDGQEQSNGIAVDSSGNAYVTGFTPSTNFPTTSGAFQTAIGTPYGNAFVTKLNPTGSALVYSTYLGGSGKNFQGFNVGDQGNGIAVDSSGNAYVAGFSPSTNFPTTSGALEAGWTNSTGLYEAFVTKINAAGTGLVYSTYLGGGGSTTVAGGVAVDSSGNAYLAGYTTSTNFPGTSSSLIQSTYPSGNSNGTAFVAKVNAGGTGVVYSTYLGGSTIDVGTAIAVDSSGNAYVTGYTESADFHLASPIQSALGDGIDAFVAKINAAGTALVYSTYLGGSDRDWGYGIAADSSGNAYVTGITRSTDFPVANAIQSTLGGGANGDDAFVTKINTGGTALVYSTYLGGSGDDAGLGIAADPSGNAYVTGYTFSPDFPGAGLSAIQSSLNGPYDALAAKIASNPPDFSLGAVSSLTVPVGGSGSSPVTINSLFGFSSPVTLSASSVPAGVSASFNSNPITPPSGGSATSTLNVTLGPSVTPSTSMFTVTGANGANNHSTQASVTAMANASGVTSVIGSLLGAGCISNSGIANALTSKLSAAQAAIGAGNIQTAINILNAFQDQVQAQSGKHIATSCTIGGVTFNPVTVLLSDAQGLIGSLKVSMTADPITGYVVNSSGVGVGGATVSIVSGANTVAPATTDITGFYFFPTTGVLTSGANYTVGVSGLPSGFTSSAPASQAFTWEGTAVAFSNFVLN